MFDVLILLELQEISLKVLLHGHASGLAQRLQILVVGIALPSHAERKLATFVMFLAITITELWTVNLHDLNGWSMLD